MICINNNNDFPNVLGVPGEEHKTSPSASVKIYPSRPPAHVEQQKRQQRLQRQKDVGHFFRRSTSESLPDEEEVTLNAIDLKNRSNSRSVSFLRFASHQKITEK